MLPTDTTHVDAKPRFSFKRRYDETLDISGKIFSIVKGRCLFLCAPPISMKPPLLSIRSRRAPYFGFVELNSHTSLSKKSSPRSQSRNPFGNKRKTPLVAPTSIDILGFYTLCPVTSPSFWQYHVGHQVQLGVQGGEINLIEDWSCCRKILEGFHCTTLKLIYSQILLFEKAGDGLHALLVDLR